MIIDLERSEWPESLTCDIAIVGAGAVGLVMAATLARRGVDVLVLEGGGASLESASQDLSKGRSLGRGFQGLENGRFRLLGGTTNFWGGQVVRFDPIVFAARSWACSEGWPIGREDIDPYYDRCAELLGLGSEGDEGVWARAAVSPPNLGRDIDVFLTRWLPEPTLTHFFKADLAGTKLRVLVHANVVGIEAEGPRITGVRAKTLSGRTVSVTANQVVLACGTIEIARLLLLPLASGEPAPWATNPWIGRAFMDHVDAEAGEVRILDTTAFHGAFDNIYIDRRKYNPKLKLAENEQLSRHLLGVEGHFIFRSAYREHLDNVRLVARSLLGGRLPPRARQLPAHLASLWKVAAPMVVRYLRSHRAFNPSDAGVTFMLCTEQQPVANSALLLDDHLDALGLPRIAVDWRVEGRELETMAHFAESVRNALLRSGLAELTLDPLLQARDARFLNQAQDGFHQMGGARMASTASSGVVDAALRVHSTDNLYVAGAAVFPSGGFANPTFTSMALGLRLCDHLLQERR